MVYKNKKAVGAFFLNLPTAWCCQDIIAAGLRAGSASIFIPPPPALNQYVRLEDLIPAFQKFHLFTSMKK
jgi:hypothetical protein